MRIRVGEYRYSPGWALFVAVFLVYGLVYGAVMRRIGYEEGVAQR